MAFGQIGQVPISPDLNPAPMASMPGRGFGPLAEFVKPKPKINWLGVLADALAGAAGQKGPYAAMMAEEVKRQRELDDYSRKRTDDNADWMTHEQWKRDHPSPVQPTEYERMLQAGGYAPGTQEYLNHIRSYLNMKENPPYYFTDPTTGQLKMVPRSAVPGSPAPEGVTFTPLDDGGPSPSGSGGFL